MIALTTPFMLAYAASEALARAAATPHQPAKTDRKDRPPEPGAPFGWRWHHGGQPLCARRDTLPFPMMQAAPGSGGA